MNNGIKNGMFTFILIQVVFLLIFYVKTRMLGDLTNIFFNGSWYPQLVNRRFLKHDVFEFDLVFWGWHVVE